MNSIIENLTWMVLAEYLIKPSLKWIKKATRGFRVLVRILFMYVTRRLWPQRIRRRAERAMVCLAFLWLFLRFSKAVERRTLSAQALA